MIDLRRPVAHVPEREIRQLANAWVNEPAMVKVAERIARLCHIDPGEPYRRFRAELAIVCAEQYLQGRETGRARIVTLPELPRIRPD